MQATPPSALHAADPPLSGCGQIVRRYDYDRYLTCLFAKPPEREAMFAVFAFNLEVAKAREMVTEPTLGQIRLQWWRESVEEIYRGVPRWHEVVGPLAQAVTRHDLTRAHFDRVIDAREAELPEEQPARGGRSAERRVGKGGVRKCNSRGGQ